MAQDNPYGKILARETAIEGLFDNGLLKLHNPLGWLWPYYLRTQGPRSWRAEWI